MNNTIYLTKFATIVAGQLIILLALAGCGGSTRERVIEIPNLSLTDEEVADIFETEVNEPEVNTESGVSLQQPPNTQIITNNFVRAFFPTSWVDNTGSVDVSLQNPLTGTTCAIDSAFIPGSSLLAGVDNLSGLFSADSLETTFIDLNGTNVARLTGAGPLSVPAVLQIAYESQTDLAHTLFCVGDIENADVQLILDSMVLVSLDG